MTEYGFNVRNRTAFLQLDNQYIDYFLKESGNDLHVDGGPSLTTVNFANTYAYNRAPLVAFRPITATKAIAIDHFKVTGGKISGFYCFAQHDSTCHMDWRLYCLDYAPAPPAHGIQLFNNRGNQIFCSSEDQLKIAYGGGSRIIPVPDELNLGNSSVTISHPDYENPFYVLQPNSFIVRGSGYDFTWTNTWMRGGVGCLDATSCNVLWVPKSHIGSTVMFFAVSYMDLFIGIVPEKP